MEHYYSRIPMCRSDEKLIQCKINGTDFRFITNNGVFSKKHLDFATEFLLKVLLTKENIKGKVLDSHNIFEARYNWDLDMSKEGVVIEVEILESGLRNTGEIRYFYQLDIMNNLISLNKGGN